MKCTSFGWSPVSWPQIQCVSSFRECGDVTAIGRLCHSDSVRRLRWSSFFPLSHPWRATTGPEHHGENECWMKIDAAFEFQISGSCFIHLWAVDTIIPPVTLDRWGHCLDAGGVITSWRWSHWDSPRRAELLLFLTDTMWIELVAFS